MSKYSSSSIPPQASTQRAAQRDRARAAPFGRRTDAIGREAPLRPTPKGVPNPPPEDPTPGSEGERPPTDRDAAILEALARLRLLSYPQLRRAFFPGRSLEAVGQRVRTLERAGWVTVFEHRTPRGGHPRYVLPTRRGLGFGLGAIRAELEAAPHHARLVARMLPAGRKAALELGEGTQPAFLAHQRECNHLALTLSLAGPAPVRWASTWDRPFPPRVGDVAMPQPDGVLVLEGMGAPRLVFLEHDRGQESLAHFAAAKVERYAELAVRPELCEELLGFPTFAVWVTVLDARFRRPLRRLRALSDVARRAGAEDLLSFTLAGWANDAPRERIWFARGTLPETDSVAQRDHAGELTTGAAVLEPRPGSSLLAFPASRPTPYR